MYKVLPLFKSHYSLGRSILTLDKPSGQEGVYPISIFDLLTLNHLPTLVLVEDNMSGLLQASKQADECKVKLVFGLRIDVCDDITVKDEASLNRRAKYIVFAKNVQGYSDLTKVWSYAAQEGFYYTPNIDFKTLRKMWTKNLNLAVPFYDSFLHLNNLCSYVHVPELSGFGQVVFLQEDNSIPFDEIIAAHVKSYCRAQDYPILPAQSIFYKCADDYLAYVAFRCLHNRGTYQKSTLEKPELNHMTSDEFNFDKWFKANK